MKVLNIIGTRPEAIKLAIFHKLLLEDDKFESILCFTGQHPSLASDVFDQFDINPDYCCLVKNHNESLAFMISYLIKALQELVAEIKPDLIVVQGDTLSSYCGSTIAFLNQIKLAHVEAGLRTYNKWAPFPEDVFRRLNGIMADIHFAPSKTAVENLINEGVERDQIYQVGNTGIDALLFIVEKINSKQIDISLDVMDQFQRDENQKVILVTIHRRENHQEFLKQLLIKLRSISQKNNFLFICLMHPNPEVRKVYLDVKDTHHLRFIEPFSYPDFVWAMLQCDLIITDSGGIQEEAPYLGKPVLIARKETEREEVLNGRSCQFINLSTLDEDILHLLENKDIEPFQPYGDGKTSEQILKVLKGLNI